MIVMGNLSILMQPISDYGFSKCTFFPSDWLTGFYRKQICIDGYIIKGNVSLRKRLRKNKGKNSIDCNLITCGSRCYSNCIITDYEQKGHKWIVKYDRNMPP